MQRRIRFAPASLISLALAALMGGCGAFSEPSLKHADALLETASHARSVSCTKGPGQGLNCLIVGKSGLHTQCREQFFVKNGKTGIEGMCFGDAVPAKAREL